MEEKKMKDSLDRAVEVVRLLSVEDKSTSVYFFSRMNVRVNVTDGHLFFEKQSEKAVRQVLNYFKVQCTRWTGVNAEGVSFVRCNTDLLRDLAWFSLPYLNAMGVLEVPMELVNSIAEEWNFAVYKRFTNAYRWFAALSLLYLAELQDQKRKGADEADISSKEEEESACCGECTTVDSKDNGSETTCCDSA
jgi:hypothetical protein